MAPLQHSMLQSLVLRAGAYIPYNLDSLPLLQVLTLPALQTLDVGWAYLPSDAALFPAFLEKSPAIKHLTAALCQSKDPDTFPPIVTEPRGVVPALRKLPALTTLCLELENHEVMFDIVSRLRDQLFLRRLESISFSIALLRSGWHIPLNITTVFGHIHTALILEALTSRSGGPRSSAVQLREFAFTWPQGMWDPEALEQLHDSVQALQARSAVRVHLSEVVPRFAY
ncbi:hypothetical protein B0H16DRAFT_1545276 [Mycena metata]|uniref:Uncharacterized protein n=1 Tax=Mycena metata TaxID=1033252 RepID=A0AAD7N9W1_9AGAR|nr:hypothetical protein B0H16DRAFT_1545276 [Mycena metata]